jgi:ribonuclease E
MAKKMLIDATHSEETRVVLLNGNRLEEYDFETSTKKQLKGNIYLAKVTRVEPSLQACFVEFGGNRHGFLAFGEIHPDYWQIPIADREALLAEERRLAERENDDNDDEEREPRRRRRVRDDGDRDQDAAAAETGPEPLSTEPFPTEPGSEPGADTFIPSGEANAAAVDPTVPQHDSASAPYAGDPLAWNQAPANEPAPGASALDVPSERVVGPETGDAGPAESISPTTDGNGATELGEEPPPAPVKLESVGGDDADEDEEEARRPRFKPMRHYKIQEVIKRRQVLLVQVVKEERGTKGAALTTYISLAGRYCVLMPNTTRGGGISRRITSQQDRKRLKEIMHDLQVPDGMAVILRTAGMERAKPEIRRDYEYLMRLWDDVRELTLNSRAPTLVYEEGSLIKRTIRDLFARDIEEIQVEGQEGFEAARAFMKMLMPDHAEKIRLYDDPQVPLFQRHQVEAQLDEMHDNSVRLRSGGYIVLNQTEALVAIDVNSGRATRERHIEETALKTNLEAADEVARQVRLRDLAGLIVIDFIDMEDNRHIAQVERRLKEAMRTDRARIQIGRISPFGLLELSRQRLRPSLAEVSTQKCPHCAGTGFIRSTESTALRVLRGIEEEGMKSRSVALKVSVPASVAIYILNQKRTTLTAIERRHNLEISFEPDDSLVPPAYRLERMKARERGDIGPAPVRAGIDMAQDEIPGEDLSPMPVAASTEDVGDRYEPRREVPVGASADAQHDEDQGGPEAAEGQGSGEDGGRGRRRRRRRRGRGRGREDGAPATGEGAAFDRHAGAGGSDAAAAAVQGQPDDAGPAAVEQVPAAEGAAAPEAEMRDASRPRSEGDDESGRRRRRGRRGGRRRRPEDGQPSGETSAAAGAQQRYEPYPTQAIDAMAPPPPSIDDDLRARAREIYGQHGRFAPTSEPAPITSRSEEHEWPWNRRSEAQPVAAPPVTPQAAPPAEEPSPPATTTTTVVIAVPTTPAPAPAPEPAPAPTEVAAPAEVPAPIKAESRTVEVGPVPEPAAPTAPAAQAEPEPTPEPQGPPRRGWWRRLTS